MRLARRGLEAAEQTDAIDVINRSLALLAVSTTLARRVEEAATLGASAVAHAEAKGDVGGAAWIRRRLAGLGVTVP